VYNARHRGKDVLKIFIILQALVSIFYLQRINLTLGNGVLTASGQACVKALFLFLKFKGRKR